MKMLLIFNAIALAVAVIAIIALLGLWLQAEKKLAQYGASKLIKKRGARK